MTLLDTRPDVADRPLPYREISQRARWRLRYAAVCVLFAALCLNSAAGRITPDTKIDLVTDPGHFLGRALRLWDPQGFAGQLQNQAYGYLFPMGPFFWLLHSLGVPGWVAQRLWWTLLLSVAFLGVVRLGRVLSLGTPLSRTIAGIGYACSPHVLTLLGANSVESLPLCVAPWIVLPLVRGAQGGSARRAGLLCGLAVLCMGGVNAAADLAALLPAILWLLTRRRTRHVAALVAWSIGGGLLATFWWLVPLLLQGRYSPPFLDYIENANTTTAFTPLVETLRGTSDWAAYLPSDGWHAGYLLLTQPALIVESVVVAGLGLAGVAASRSGHRPWLALCLGAGLVLVTLGHAGSVGSLFAGHERALLDTTLAPIRNIHKFDLLIRLPLALGLADLLPRVAWGRRPGERARAATLARLVAAVAVLGTATPMITLALANSHSYASVPGYWRQTASWLAAHGGDGRALLAPSSTTPTYYWGTPTDEPLQPLARSAWEVRNNIPLVAPGHIRSLDAVDALLATGVTQPQLASYLARSGVRYLVARNDLDYEAVGALAPGVVQATLAASPGLTRVTSFGPVIGGAGDFSYSVDQGLQPPLQAIDIWRVDATGDPRVTTADGLTQISGGPESVLQLAQAGVDVGAATVLSGSSTAGLTPERVVLTDGLRRREVNYGGASGQHSDTLTAGDDGRIGRHVLDYLPVPGETHQSVVRYLGARSITASSSGADPDGFFPVQPDAQPYSAFDGDPTTGWASAPATAPLGQWVQVGLSAPTSLPSVRVQLPTPSPVTRITITTGTSMHSYAVPSDGAVDATLHGRTDRLRVTVGGVIRGYRGQVGITEITAPGLHVSRTVVAPRDLPSGRVVDSISFATPGDARNGCLMVAEAPRCIAGRARTSEDGSGLDRTFTLPRGAEYGLAVAVAPRPGSALTAMLDEAAGYAVTATASSQAVPDPLAGPQSVVDGDGSTGWVAARADPDPTITLHFAHRVTISELHLLTTPDLAATRPDLLRVTSATTSRQAVVQTDGTASFAAVTTDELAVHLRTSLGLRRVVSSSLAGQTRVGIGVSEIEIPGVTVTTRNATAARRVDLPCGSGPTVAVAGRRVATRVSTTVQAVRDLDPVSAIVCDDTPVDLPAGTLRLVAAGTDLWTTRSVLLTRTGSTAPGAAAPNATAPTARVRRWGATDRVVDVGARTSSALLVVNENANTGWRATLRGHVLPTVLVDGWRQGYRLPPGNAGTVRLTFTPQRPYLVALVVGAIAVALLVVTATLLVRRRPATVRGRIDGARVAPRVLAGAAVVTCLLVGGPVGAGVGAVTALTLLGVRHRAGRDPSVGLLAPAVALGAVVIAGVLLALAPWPRADYAANTATAQVVCLVAVAAAITGTGRGGGRAR